ncbi:hypothetical protein QVD17_00233 [Tagetes erecta]|uniref:Uncharacterized protein n=1 Tax=Tagetes erecta TaxID=13708 RepID=A0AAD8P0E6_TARER|nr:hypothetical protein QVD17_00233 [Tagetes erecta]
MDRSTSEITGDICSWGSGHDVYNTKVERVYVDGGGFKKDVPLLQDIVVMEDLGHFLNQEKRQESTAIIHDFIKKF